MLLRCCDRLYALLNRALIFRFSAQRGHDGVIELLRRLDDIPLAIRIARRLHRAAWQDQPLRVGGARLPHPLIPAAGLVKGDGYNDETAALAACDTERNIMPGWRVLPALLGPIEFGSFTRHPRLGNAGATIRRLSETRSTQNRIGLRNPGARAAASFLGQRRLDLPAIYGINIALTPGEHDINQQARDVVQSLGFFLEAGLKPAWVTLNLSCPNTEDDPGGRQLDAETRRLCSAMIEGLRSPGIPLWVKVSPGLAATQYRSLARIFHDVGVKAVIATNTLALPSPGHSAIPAGIGGGQLFDAATTAVRHLRSELGRANADIDIIACGGILDGGSYRAYCDLGAKAAQYWSALVYRGPLAAALIMDEAEAHKHEYEAIQRESLA